MRDTTALTRALAARRPGDVVVLTVQDDHVAARTVPLTLQTFPSADLFPYFIVPYALGLALLAVALWVVRGYRGAMAGRALALLCATAAVVVGLFDLPTTHAFSWAWTLALPAAGGALLALVLVSPQRFSFAACYPVVRRLGFIPAGLLAVVGEWALYDLRRPLAYAQVWRADYAFVALSLLAFLGCLACRGRCAPMAAARTRARLLLGGSALAFAPIIFFLAGAAAPAANAADQAQPPAGGASGTTGNGPVAINVNNDPEMQGFAQGASTAVVGSNDGLSVGGSQSVTVSGNTSLSVAGSQSETVTSNPALTVAGDEQPEAVGYNDVITVAGGESTTAGTSTPPAAAVPTIAPVSAASGQPAGEDYNLTPIAATPAKSDGVVVANPAGLQVVVPGATVNSVATTSGDK